ncbi:MAG: hypothetical protein FWD47_04115 [Treponema sp.]|nr:hypothetical protein [Treponema sp.]
MDRQYSFIKQIKNDYFTFLSLIGFAIFLAAFIGVSVFGIALTKRDGLIDFSEDPFFQMILGIIFGSISLLCLVWFIFRIRAGKYFVDNGLELEAEIFNVFYERDRGRIEYSYEINNNIFKRGSAVPKYESSKIYEKGEKIKILVHPINNNKNVIKDHFII